MLYGTGIVYSLHMPICRMLERKSFKAWTSNAHSMRIGCVHTECALNRSGLNAH